jgi:hypothetical protein
MSDGLTRTPSHKTEDARPARRHAGSPWRRPARVVVPVQVLTVLALFAASGALCGWVWYRIWDVPSGVVAGGQWYTSEAGLRDDFAGTGWYVAIALGAGLVLGALSAWLLDRSEVATTLAVIAGSMLAGWVMLRVGYHLSPPDPVDLARTAEDGTRLEGALRVPSWPPRGAFPFGALLGLAGVYAVLMSRTPTEIRTTPTVTDHAPRVGRVRRFGRGTRG